VGNDLVLAAAVVVAVVAAAVVVAVVVVVVAAAAAAVAEVVENGVALADAGNLEDPAVSSVPVGMLGALVDVEAVVVGGESLGGVVRNEIEVVVVAQAHAEVASAFVRRHWDCRLVGLACMHSLAAAVEADLERLEGVVGVEVGQDWTMGVACVL
jgi:hypothetical protein